MNSHRRPMAPVTGFARSFLTGNPIPDATITILENGKKYETNDDGRFYIEWPVGEDITLILEKNGYKTTQSATFTVPEGGLTGRLNEISFQVPDALTYPVFKSMIGIKINEVDHCQVICTVTDHDKTMDDLPHGAEDAEIILSSPQPLKKFYFGIISNGFLSFFLQHKTDPRANNLTRTSKDGGVGIADVPARDEPYTLTARIPGKNVSFTSVRFKARKGAFINISPPHGPRVIKTPEELALEKERAFANLYTTPQRCYNLFGLFAATSIAAAAVAVAAGAIAYKKFYPD